jgi:hypothetical protein
MKFFDKNSKRDSTTAQKTTRGFFIGIPEAEGESSGVSK